MKNPLNRLLFYGLFGLAVSSAIIVENFISKRNTVWEYLIGFALLLSSIVFLIGRSIIKRRQK